MCLVLFLTLLYIPKNSQYRLTYFIDGPFFLSATQSMGLSWQCLTLDFMNTFLLLSAVGCSKPGQTSTSLVPVLKRHYSPQGSVIYHTLATIHSHVNVAHKNLSAGQLFIKWPFDLFFFFFMVC